MRAATWVALPALAGAAVLASLAAVGPRTGAELARAALAWVRCFAPGPVFVAALGAGQFTNRAGGRIGPVARGLALAAVLLAVFLPLFVTADPAFADMVDDALGWDVDRPVDRFAAALLVLALAGALALARGAESRPAGPARARVGRVEWTIALVGLNALFLAFLAVQLTALFGGHDYVQRSTGLTYAQYARQGFGQLLVVAGLTLAVVGAAWRWARRDTRREERALKLALGVLCVLTLAVVASALRRLGLYEAAFGSTRLRMAAQAGTVWVGALFVLMLVAGTLKRETWLPRAVSAVSAVALLGFGLSNPDARIAERNVARFERTGQIDLYYAAGLSPDAAPALARLPPEQARDALELMPEALGEPEGLAGLNLGRARARAALRTR